MTARALLLACALLAAAPARAETPFERLRSAEEPADRVLACAELAKPPHRGPNAYDALSRAMKSDLSERVRLAAAVAALTYTGGRTLADGDEFLKAEPGSAVRRDFLIALSSEPAQFVSPEATRIIAASLLDDPSDDVRLAAARSAGERGDPLAIGAVRAASEKDKSKAVREAAKKALGILSTPPKPKPVPKVTPPKNDAVKGKDPCPPPWGWCGCSGAIKLKPRCLTRDECRGLQSKMASNGLVCSWDGHAEQ